MPVNSTERKQLAREYDRADAVRIARENQPDAYVAAEELEEAGFSFGIAREALMEVFGYDVLAAGGAQ